jgi:tRNA uridine 5-carboxymethylaminomethyl modification enzyme
MSLLNLLRRSEVSYSDVESISGAASRRDVAEQVEIAAKYEGYIQRQIEQIEAAARREDAPIPGDIEYGVIKSLSTESRQKLTRVRPPTIGAASRIPGVTPADIMALTIWIEKLNRRPHSGFRSRIDEPI